MKVQKEAMEAFAMDVERGQQISSDPLPFARRWESDVDQRKIQKKKKKKRCEETE